MTRDLWVKHLDIEWRKIVDLRNIVAHGYGELRMVLIWNLSQNEVPILAQQLQKILDEADPS